MKKLALTMVSLSVLLAACSEAGNSSSSLPSSSPVSSQTSSSSGGNPFVESGWSEEEAAILYPLFEDHLYPFYDFESLGYSYEISTYEETKAMTSFSLVIEDFPVSEAERYFRFMTDGTGYVDQRKHYDTPAGYYVVEKEFPGDYSRVAGSWLVSDASGNIITEGRGQFELDIHPVKIARDEWQGDKVEQLVEAQLGLTISLPEPSKKEGHYMSVLSSISRQVYPTLLFVGSDARESYGADLVSAGWHKIPTRGSDVYFEDGAYYTSPDERVGVSVHMATDSVPSVTLLQFEKAFYSLSYPDYWVDDCLETLLLTSSYQKLPVPEAEGVTYYHVNNLVNTEQYFDIIIHGVNYVEAYEKLLLDNGFRRVFYYQNGDYYVYGDRTETYCIVVDYVSEPEYDDSHTYVRVYTNFPGYHAGWPASAIAKMVDSLGGKTPLPADDEATFTDVIDFLQSGYFNLMVQTFADDGSFLDTTERYAALLNAEGSGWTYDSIENRWHDAEKKLSAALHFQSNSGLLIHIEPYKESHASLPEEELSAALENIGVEGYSFVALDGASGYSLDTSTSGRVYVTVWGVESGEIEPYRQKLLANGHSMVTINSTYCFWDDAKKVGFDLVYDQVYQCLTIDLIEYNDCYNYSGPNLQTYVEEIKAEYDPSFSLPSLPVEEGTMGYIRLPERTSSTLRLYIYVFVDSIIDSYGPMLLESGWTAETSRGDYIIQESDIYWSLQMYELGEYCYIDILSDRLPTSEGISTPWIYA